MNPVDLSLPDDFQNIVRLFPLPNLVLFPGVIQALHLFEPRYRQLMNDALDSDQLISMALIQQAQSLESNPVPQIHSTICIGKIITHARLDDGRYNLLLMGIQRAQIVREINHGTPYRMAEVELCPLPEREKNGEFAALRKSVIAQFRKRISMRPQLDEESLDELLNSNLPTGQLLDLIAYSSGCKPLDQQSVLEESDVAARGQLILQLLQEQDRAEALADDKPPGEFPPGFSLN